MPHWLLWLNKGYTCRTCWSRSQTPENERSEMRAEAFKRLQELKPRTLAGQLSTRDLFDAPV